MIVQIGVAPKLVFLDCGRFGIPNLSIITICNGIMCRSDEFCHLDQTARGAGEAVRPTPD